MSRGKRGFPKGEKYGYLTDMSVITNLVALLIIVAGYFSPFYSEAIVSAGVFALSGAVTNWLAVHMLFEKVPFLYGSGVIPLHFEEFKSGIKALIMDQFFTKENIDRFLKEEEGFLPQVELTSFADKINYNRLFDELSGVILESQMGSMLGMFGGASLLEGFREPFVTKARQSVLEELASEPMQEEIKRAIAGRDISGTILEKAELVIVKRLEELTPQMVKEILQKMIRKHLGWLVVWGGVFGGLIGLIVGLI